MFVKSDDEQSILPVVSAGAVGIANRLINLPNDPVAEQNTAGTAIRIEFRTEGRRVHVVMPDHVFEKVNEVRLDERIFRQSTFRAIAKKIRKERTPTLEIAEVVFPILVLQVAPMNQLGKRNCEILIDVPTAFSELCFQQIK